MNQDKFGQLIKKIREENHLTQRELAEKYNVTYQAVSKWENGKNLPDLSLIKQISNDFSVSIDDMVDGNFKTKKRNYRLFFIIGIIFIIFIILSFVLVESKSDFSVKPIKANCDNFNISGVLSYNESKSLIYIPSIEYCGNDGSQLFVDFECTLLEKNGNISQKVSSYALKDKLSLDEFLKKVNFKIDNYSPSCKRYNDDAFYLEIKAIDELGKTTYYNVPLSLDECL